MRVLVFNGWAAGLDTWRLCHFAHDCVFDYVEQLDGLPERVMAEIDEAVLVGFSMGGSSALRMVLKYPEKIRGLLLISATPCMSEKLAEGWRGMSSHRRAALRLGTLLTFRGNPSALYREDNLDRGLAYLTNTDLRGELEALKARGLPKFPVHIFQSERDGIVRPNNAAYLKSIFPEAMVTMVPGNEHVLPVAVPELIDNSFVLPANRTENMV